MYLYSWITLLCAWNIVNQLYFNKIYAQKKKLSHYSSYSAIWVVSSAYTRFLIFLLVILISACDPFSLAFHTMYSGCELSKQGNNIQPCCTPLSIWNQSIVPCPVRTGQKSHWMPGMALLLFSYLKPSVYSTSFSPISNSVLCFWLDYFQVDIFSPL